MDIEDIGPDFRIEVERLISSGEDQVLAFLRATVSGRATCAECSTHGAGVARYFDKWIGAFTDYWIQTDHFLDAGDQVVLQLFREGGKGKSSGVTVDREGAVVYTLRGGKITQARVYRQQAEALEAAGLSE